MYDLYKKVEEKEAYLLSNIIAPRKLKAVNDNDFLKRLKIILHTGIFFILAAVAIFLT